VADSTPVECGRSRQTVRRSALAGWAAYGYCASHLRYFWGLRLHLVTTLDGVPIAFALTNPKADEREVLVDLFDVEPGLLAGRTGVVLLVDKGYRDAATEAILAERGVRLLRPAFKGEALRPGQGLLRPLRQRIESVTRPQGPAGPGTPRRPHDRGRHRASAATPAGPDRRDLAQPPRQPAGPALPGRLRPLSPQTNPLESIV
jgi:hypothetical protein